MTFLSSAVIGVSCALPPGIAELFLRVCHIVSLRLKWFTDEAADAPQDMARCGAVAPELQGFWEAKLTEFLTDLGYLARKASGIR
ncbi:hypothetical protein ACTMU2_23175 [Cupriavidus basilensis]